MGARPNVCGMGVCPVERDVELRPDDHVRAQPNLRSGWPIQAAEGCQEGASMSDLATLAARLRALPQSPLRDALLAAVTVPCPRNKTQHAHFVGVQPRGERKPCE